VLPLTTSAIAAGATPRAGARGFDERMTEASPASASRTTPPSTLPLLGGPASLRAPPSPPVADTPVVNLPAGSSAQPAGQANNKNPITSLKPSSTATHDDRPWSPISKRRAVLDDEISRILHAKWHRVRHMDAPMLTANVDQNENMRG
jgi:hypothetical protein